MNISKNLDAVNIGLMLLALVPAMILPFELFLFVYAILGPLHYLTEINWLHKKRYFTSHRNDYIFIVVLTLVIGFLTFTKTPLKSYSSVLTFIALFSSFGFIIYRDVKSKVVFTMMGGFLGLLLFYFFQKHFRIVFSVLLPTIIHVFIFTGLFIFLGALKAKNKLGIISLVVFILCAAITLTAGNYFKSNISEFIYENHSAFRKLNRVLIHFFSFMHSQEIKSDIQTPVGFVNYDMPVYFSDIGIKIMRFIAFAYTYHYLNWFSKTSVIQWHNTKSINLIGIVVFWVLSIVLYIYNYKVGLQWLFLLSFAHVLLEFPLNHKSIIDIKNILLRRV